MLRVNNVLFLWENQDAIRWVVGKIVSRKTKFFSLLVKVDLTLPLQVCREILYGDAHKPEPVYQPEPEYKPSGYSA